MFGTMACGDVLCKQLSIVYPANASEAAGVCGYIMIDAGWLDHGDRRSCGEESDLSLKVMFGILWDIDAIIIWSVTATEQGK